ncbi:TIGR01777 family oxidoreductase [Chryseolinea soli]|uniref:TIGR01777 family protein n=1 Tax=Chryseolinea soli TaxID=2321403 RepID=A0A385SW49_9BACT|nr:TIGR01777 family oxidoreductase [Chryseolinea soli]AYB35449.1 TIGR01777 family protein [Chryseolinea soli]
MHSILITGASGLIGSRLTNMLHSHGHRVAHLGRAKRDGIARSFVWDIDRRYIERGALQDTDTIIHLAGAGIADKPWTKERKREILESRTQSTQLLYDELKKGNHSVKTIISATAVGYYGFKDEETIYKEDDPPGEDFLAQVTRRWEQEVDAFLKLNIRVVRIRIGIVLSAEGGVVNEILRPIRWYAGAPLGSGNQYLSWIHLDDLCNIFIMAVENNAMEGAYNAVAPHPATNRELTMAIANAVHKPIIFPAIPSFILKLLLGEMADLVLRGSKVSSEKIQEAGFKFAYTNVDDALVNLLQKNERVRADNITKE